MLKEILENIKSNLEIESDGVFAKPISLTKIKKLSLEDKKKIILTCLDIDSKYYNESNVIKTYTTFFPMLTGKFSGKKQDIYTMGFKKYDIELAGTMEINGLKLPEWLLLYPKKKEDKLIEINLENINKDLFGNN